MIETKNGEVWTPHCSNQRLITHGISVCDGEYCPVHNPSDHHMVEWPQHYRNDIGITERICKHGIGHPDPDDPNYNYAHGCDGCCNPERKEEVSIPSTFIWRCRNWIAGKLLGITSEDFAEWDEELALALGEQETERLEIERCHEIIERLLIALKIQKGLSKDIKREINKLKVDIGICKKRGRPRKG